MGNNFICSPFNAKNHILFLLTFDRDHSIVKEMKEVMLHKIDRYYGEDCDLGILDKAMLLDPRFKNVTFVSSDILLPELVQVASSLPGESQSSVIESSS